MRTRSRECWASAASRSPDWSRTPTLCWPRYCEERDSIDALMNNLPRFRIRSPVWSTTTGLSSSPPSTSSTGCSRSSTTARRNSEDAAQIQALRDVLRRMLGLRAISRPTWPTWCPARSVARYSMRTCTTDSWTPTRSCRRRRSTRHGHSAVPPENAAVPLWSQPPVAPARDAAHAHHRSGRPRRTDARRAMNLRRGTPSENNRRQPRS